MEKGAKKLVSSAEKQANGKKLTDNIGKLKAFAESAEAQRLLSAIGDGDINSLENSASDGKNTAEFMKKLLSSPEGRELVSKIAGITGV